VNFIKSCVAQKLAGQKRGSRLEARTALAAAARECSAEADRRGLPKRAGR
jgi:rRNA-processing protein FCF1